MVQVRRYTAQLKGQDHHVFDPFTALPLALLEVILISRTSTTDKKASKSRVLLPGSSQQGQVQSWCHTVPVCPTLRRVFQQTLDNNMTCIELKACAGKSRQCLLSWLGRLHILKAAKLEAIDDVCSFRKQFKQLNLFLPTQLTTLTIECGDINLKELVGLRSLKSLCLFSTTDKVTGIEHVCGLTHLDCYEHLGSVAHLASTLKHLTIEEFGHVQGMNQLTNLEILRVCKSVPEDFFRTHSHLPLKAMGIAPSACRGFFTSTQAWQSAPNTLTRLTLDDSYVHTWPTVLPASITHLQMMGTTIDDATATAVAAAVPGLVRLDIRYCNAADRALNRFTNLQSIGCVRDCGWQRQRVPSDFPELAKAVQRGIQFTLASDEELLGVFVDPFYVGAAWTSHN